MSDVLEKDGIEALAQQLDDAQRRMAELDPLPRQTLKDHLNAVDELHKTALTTIVRRLKQDPAGTELLFELVDDPVVHMVLAMHGIIRSSDPVAVAKGALDQIRPGIAGHGGDVQLSHIEDGVAFVRLSGACNGCSMAAVTMRNGVEKALLEAVPGLTAVEVLPNDPEPQPLLQITTVGAGAEPAPSGTTLPMAAENATASDAMADSGWFKTFPVQRIPPGTLEAMSLTRQDGDAVEVIVVNAAGQMAAFVNACAHQGLPLDKALVDGDAGTLTCPWHGMSFDATNGECLTAPGAQLQQLPLRIDAGHVWVRASN